MPEVLPVIGLAALDSLNPSAIAVALLLAVRGVGSSSLTQGAAYLAGVFLSMFTFGAVLLVAAEAAAAASDGISEPITFGIQFVVGAVLLLLGALLPSRPRSESRVRLPGSAAGLFALGVGVTFLEVWTALPYLGALALITGAGLDAAAWLPLLVVYNAIVVLPPLAILVAGRINADRVRRWSERHPDAMGSSRPLILTLLFLIGLYLVADAAYYFDFFGLLDVPQPHPARVDDR